MNNAYYFFAGATKAKHHTLNAFHLGPKQGVHPGQIAVVSIKTPKSHKKQSTPAPNIKKDVKIHNKAVAKKHRQKIQAKKDAENKSKSKASNPIHKIISHPIATHHVHHHVHLTKPQRDAQVAAAQKSKHPSTIHHVSHPKSVHHVVHHTPPIHSQQHHHHIHLTQAQRDLNASNQQQKLLKALPNQLSAKEKAEIISSIKQRGDTTGTEINDQAHMRVMQQEQQQNLDTHKKSLPSSKINTHKISGMDGSPKRIVKGTPNPFLNPNPNLATPDLGKGVTDAINNILNLGKPQRANLAFESTNNFPILIGAGTALLLFILSLNNFKVNI